MPDVLLVLDRYDVDGSAYIDEHVRVRESTGVSVMEYHYLLKELNSVAGLANANGTLIEAYDYDAYGKVRVYSGQAAPCDQLSDVDGAERSDAEPSATGKARRTRASGRCGCLERVSTMRASGRCDVDLDDYGVLLALWYEASPNAPMTLTAPDASPVNDYYFTGRSLDFVPHGGERHQRYYYRARTYNTERFMQRDPLEYVDSQNLYQYARANAANYVDPSGDFVQVAACAACVTLIGTTVADAIRTCDDAPDPLECLNVDFTSVASDTPTLAFSTWPACCRCVKVPAGKKWVERRLNSRIGGILRKRIQGQIDNVRSRMKQATDALNNTRSELIRLQRQLQKTSTPEFKDELSHRIESLARNLSSINEGIQRMQRQLKSLQDNLAGLRNAAGIVGRITDILCPI